MTTTIKVDSAVRDRLAELARTRGTTMGALLAEMTDRLEREAFFETAHRQLSALRLDDPAAWEANRGESRSWQAGTDRDALSLNEAEGWWE
jgi:hypothetical protein